MPRTLDNLRIQTRLGILAAVMVLGAMLAGAAGFIADRTVNTVLAADRHNDKLVHLAGEIHVNLLQMRRAEKDFLLTKDRNFVERHAIHSRLTMRAIDTLAALPHAGLPDRQIHRLQAAMRRYPQSFAAAVRLSVLLGLNHESGLQGGIHNASQGIERTLGQAGAYRLLVKIHEIHRLEMGITQGGKLEFIDRMDAQLTKLVSLLAKSPLPPATKAQIRRQAGEYRRTFRAWVGTERLLRQQARQMNTNYLVMRRDIVAITAGARRVENAAEEKFASVRNSARIAMLAVGILIVLVSVSLAAAIGRSIIRPLEKINAALADLAAGDNEREIPATERRDEIGDIARAAVVFKENAIAKAAAEAASEAKSSFLATASHEIRTPVNGIIGIGDLLLDSPLNDKQKSLVKTSQKSARDLVAIINGVLDHSKLEAEMVELEDHDFDLYQLVNHVLSILGVQAAAKSIGLSWHHPENLPRHLKADAGRLQQILLNLIGNAIKFTETGAVTLFVMHREGDGGTIDLRCEIKDTGIGIEPEKQGELFTRFTQAERSMTRTHGGTGLGLSISRQLAELMGGEIGLLSTPGEGSTFWFTIRCVIGAPAEEADDADDADSRQEGLDGTGATAGQHIPQAEDADGLQILVAEDNRVNQMLVKEILRAAGHTAELVENGVEAIEAVQRGSYDLVLMDVQMPELDGISATKQIRALPGPMGQVPIIAVTAHAMVGDRETYIAAGMDEYVSKPVDRKVLFQTIERTLESRRQAPNDAQQVTKPDAAPLADGKEGPASADHEAPPAPASPDTDSLPVLETTVIEEWKSFLSPNKFEELISSHVGFARSCVPLLQERGQSGSLAELAELAHDLKGTCSSLGMSRVQQLAADLETACKEKRAKEARELVDTVEAAIVDGVAAIEKKYAA